MRGPRIGALAGGSFVLVGVIELLLTGGPAPDPPTVLGSVDFFRGTADAAPAIAVLSAVAGALFLVFAVQLRQVVADDTVAGLAWAGAILTVALAWTGQAAQQIAWLGADDLDGSAVAALGALTGFLFAFALVGGGVLAGSTAVAALREQVLPGWSAVLGVLAAIAPLVAVAVPSLAGVGFPVFLLWLFGTSVALARLPGPAPTTSATTAGMRPGGTDVKES